MAKQDGKQFEAEGEARDLEFTEQDQQAYDPSEDVEGWEAATESDTGRRQSDSKYVKGTVQARGQDQLDRDLRLESTAQTGGSRNEEVTTMESKQSTRSKSRTSQPIPKRSNPMTSDIHGAAEKRSGGESVQGITSRPEGEEDRRQAKVVSIRNDAKAGGKRTGSKKAV